MELIEKRTHVNRMQGIPEMLGVTEICNYMLKEYPFVREIKRAPGGAGTCISLG